MGWFYGTEILCVVWCWYYYNSTKTVDAPLLRWGVGRGCTGPAGVTVTAHDVPVRINKPRKKYAKMILLPFWKQYLFLRKKRRNLVKAMKGLARRRLAARTDACMQVGGGTTGTVASFVLRLPSVRRPPALLKSRSQLR